MSEIRVLLVDDHSVVRLGLRTALGAYSNIVIVGEASTGVEALALARTQQPDVVIMDLWMPEMNGIEATRKMLATRPNTRILMMTMNVEIEILVDAIRAGALGYITKNCTHDDLKDAVLTVAAGQSVLSPELTTALFKYINDARLAKSPYPFPDLTEREREVLQLLVTPLTNREIAEKLEIRQKTVNNYVTSIISKLQAHDRTEAARVALAAGISR